MSEFIPSEYYGNGRNDRYSTSSKNIKYVRNHTEDLLMSNIDMYDFDLSMQLLQFKVDKMKRDRINVMQSLENIKSRGNSVIYDYPTKYFNNTDNEIKCFSERIYSRRMLSPNAKSEVMKKIGGEFESDIKPIPELSSSLPKSFNLDNIFSEEDNTTKQSEYSEIKKHIKNVSSR